MRGFVFPSADKMPFIIGTSKVYFDLNLNLEHLQEDIIKLHEAAGKQHNVVDDFEKDVYFMLRGYSTLEELYVDFPELKKVDLTPPKRKVNTDKIKALITPEKKTKGKKKNV